MKEKEQQMLETIIKAAADKKAVNIVSLDMHGVSLVTDYFIICSGRSTTQVKAITDEIEEKMRENNFHLLHREGYEESRWVLLDYNDVVVHIFLPELREFYNLERLWGDAEAVSYDL